jgi:hypothetical protein
MFITDLIQEFLAWLNIGGLYVVHYIKELWNIPLKYRFLWLGRLVLHSNKL